MKFFDTDDRALSGRSIIRPSGMLVSLLGSLSSERDARCYNRTKPVALGPDDPDAYGRASNGSHPGRQTNVRVLPVVLHRRRQPPVHGYVEARDEARAVLAADLRAAGIQVHGNTERRVPEPFGEGHEDALAASPQRVVHEPARNRGPLRLLREQSVAGEGTDNSLLPEVAEPRFKAPTDAVPDERLRLPRQALGVHGGDEQMASWYGSPHRTGEVPALGGVAAGGSDGSAGRRLGGDGMLTESQHPERGSRQ